MNNSYDVMHAGELSVKKITMVLLNLGLFYIFVYSFLAFYDLVPLFSSYNITVFSIIAVCITFFVFLNSGRRYGLSTALLLYTIATQFGMSTIYYLLGPKYLDTFSLTTLRFLSSTQYERAILLGIVAIISFVYGSKLGISFKKKTKQTKKTQSTIGNINNEDNAVYIIGILLLILVFIYLLFFMLTGKIRLGMSYHSYLNSGIVNGLYSWILLFYATGISFVVSVGNKFQTRIGFVIFLLSAMIFFSTGNRGEVLYAILGVIGILYYKNEKIKFKYVALVLGILFILIPFIKATRHIGTISSFHLLSLDLVEPFAEMGHQLRLSVLILEEFSNDSRELLFGFSYYNPLINILDYFIPGNVRLQTPENFNFSEAFSGLGFSQIAESYANFGIIGVVLFYFLLGFILRRAETSGLSGVSLAYWGAILAILINATRNRFAFVPGSILIVLILIYIVKLIASNKRKVSRRRL